MLKSAICVAFLSVLAAAPAAAGEYIIDPSHTQVEFTYSHFGFSHITGRFDSIEGRLSYDPENPTAATVAVKVSIDSLDTGVDKLDAHLKSADFFDANQFPGAEFKSTTVEVIGDGKLKMNGDLTIHGVTKPVVFEVTVNKLGEHPMKKVPAAGFDASSTIKRSDFGIGRYVPNISDEVRIDITVEATQKPATDEDTR